MEDPFLYGLLAMIIPVALARKLLQWSLNRLSPEKKEAVLASVKGMQKIRLILLAALIGLLFLLPRATAILAPGYLLGMSLLYWNRIAATNPPREYKTAYVTSVLLGLVGIGAFF
ncbi:MAG: hypothetical protein DSY50_00205 [Desulfobulbus sp.]|nr:MAG: hypothetical protein DSY50_00205 [Desulfobulbus sp.]